MIDFSILKTIEEKLIVLFLSLNSCTFKKIVKTLKIDESGCRRVLKKLIKSKIIQSVQNDDFDVVEYHFQRQNPEKQDRILKSELEPAQNPLNLNLKERKERKKRNLDSGRIAKSAVADSARVFTDTPAPPPLAAAKPPVLLAQPSINDQLKTIVKSNDDFADYQLPVLKRNTDN